MQRWWRKTKNPTGLTLSQDPYGYSVDKRPSFLMRSWFEKMISKTSMPDDQQRQLEELSQEGHIIYAFEYRSHLDFVYLSLRLYQLGLPAPSFLFDIHPYFWQPRWYACRILAYHFYHYIRNRSLPDPYANGYYQKKIEDGETGLFFLLGEKGYYRRTVLVGHDPVEHLIDIQKSRQKPIFIVPLVLLYTRDPGRKRRGFGEIFFGQKEQPGPIRKCLSFLRGYSSAAFETGEALNLQEILGELSDKPNERRKQIFQLRRELIDSIAEIKRAIVGPRPKTKLELKEIILHHPRLEAQMQRRAKASEQEIWKIRKEADQYLDEIAANYNYTLIQIAEKFLTWVWNNLFDGIDVDVESLHQVKRAARHNTLVYIPCHKSHIDYLILSYILFRNNLYSPFVAAGKNLSFWPLGPLFRRGGAFFIRRSFKGIKFYAEVFSLYVKTMVQLGHNIEFFIEGGRSRTGKMVLPKLGLMAILIQAVEEGFCDDLVFVPTSICYDRIPEEESYLKEVSGGAKVDENIGQLVRARRFLKKRYGRVYVQFAEPISLQRYLERFQLKMGKLRPKERHAMYRDFSYRIINSINQASLVTPHALVAIALLSTPRHGISMAEFKETCRVFYDYLVVHKIRFSKTLSNYDLVIGETLGDLERSKIIGKLKDEDDDLEEEVYTLEDSKRLTTEYYKNNAIHFFLPAAYVSTSILAQQTFQFSLAQILEDVAFMKNFFKYEFVYDSEIPDQSLVEGVLDAFEEMGWLHPIGQDDHPYLLTHKGMKVAHFFSSVLRNYFEGYWLVLRAFKYLQKKSYSDKEFAKKVLSLGQKALKLQLIERPESVSRIIFANALKYYVEKGVIDKKIGGTKGKEKDQYFYVDTSNRLLIQHYSKQISRLLRSPHFSLQ